MSAIYRIQQFIRAVGSRSRPADGHSEFAARYLPPAAVPLFRGMSGYDQQHARDVCLTLEQRGHTEPDLLAAALLHDVGKSVAPAGRVRLWHRVAVVLIHILWPGLLGQLARDEPASWRWPFYVQVHHAAIGAEAARKVGCSAAAADLIRRHEDAPGQTPDPLLAALQAADSEN